jgi:hypothetical protein
LARARRISTVAELGDLTRFDTPRQLAAFVGLVPSEYSSGSSRRQGGITKAGNGRARRVLVEAAWAYRHPAKVSLHIQQRIDQLPKALQDLGWKAQVRLCKRYRRLVASMYSRRHNRANSVSKDRRCSIRNLALQSQTMYLPSCDGGHAADVAPAP